MAFEILSDNQIVIDRAALGDALNALMEDPYDAQSGYTRARVERALWEWLKASAEALVNDAVDLTVGPASGTARVYFGSVLSSINDDGSR